MMLAAAAAAATGTTGSFVFTEAAAAAASAAGGAGTGTDACRTNIPCTGYYLLSSEARQRLASAVPDVGSEAASPYESAAHHHSGSWNFTGFGASSYVPQLPAYPHSSSNSELTDRRQTVPAFSMIKSESGIRNLGREIDFTEEAFEVGYYLPEQPANEESPTLTSSRLEALYPVTNSPTLSSSNFTSRLSPGFDTSLGIVNQHQTTPRTSPGLEIIPMQSSNSNSSKEVGKRTKKPFTIENIIAPDEEEKASRESFKIAEMETTSLLSMPKPFYAAGYPLSGVITCATIRDHPMGRLRES